MSASAPSMMETAVVVGVNLFTQNDTTAIPIQRIDETLERRQIERVRAFRLRRDPVRWQASLDRVREHARAGQNLMPGILEAVESSATVGEVAETMRSVFGEFKETVAI